ncbi:hypothetical protein [Moorena sp. SIO1F2]|nr:hypothetical protein [Moorena sp. SIO1F2]
MALAFGPRYANGHATRTNLNLITFNIKPDNNTSGIKHLLSSRND